jgi:glutathione S-transferase
MSPKRVRTVHSFDISKESRAIARHVLRKHRPELLGAGAGGSLERAAMVDVWLEVEAHQLSPPAVAIVVECFAAPLLGRERDQTVVDENVEKLRKVLEVYEARLGECR